MAESTPPGGSGPGNARSLKFKPKKVDRRSELERSVAAHQIEQEQQQQARAAASAQPTPPPWQRRERPPYRKAEQTRQGAGPVSAAAAVASSTSLASLQHQPALSTPPVPTAAAGSEAIVVATGSSAPATSSTPQSAKQPAKSASSRARVKKEKAEEAEKPFVVYYDENSDEDGVYFRNKRHTAARDVDHLDSASDSEIEFANSQGPPLRPISLMRHEHVDRVKNLNTEATSAASARLRQRQQEQRQHEEGVKVDPEPTNGDDVEMHDASSSPVVEVADTSSFLTPHATDEDRAEANRLRADRLAVLDELGPSAPAETRDRHIYMFQFPPLLPNLIPPPTSTSSSSMPPPAPFPSATRRGKGKQKASAAPIAPSAAAEEHSASAPPDAAVPPPLHMPDRPTVAGHVGTLRVYSDGSAALAWGGLEHEVRAGVSGQLLQHVVLAKGLDERSAEEKKRKKMEGEEALGNLEGSENLPKEGAALGSIRKTFVVTPGWAQLLEKAG